MKLKQPFSGARSNMNSMDSTEDASMNKRFSMNWFSNTSTIVHSRAVIGVTLAALGSPVVATNTVAADSMLLSNAIVHTISGETFSPGQVLIRDGKIESVGKSTNAAGARIIDLSGTHLYPGLIALNTVLGLTEIQAVRSTQDSAESGDFTPDVESWIAANPDSELIPVARANGIAYFQPVPQGTVVSGQSGLVAVDGWTTEQRTIRSPVALHVFWPTMQLNISSRAGRREKGKSKSLDEQSKDRRARVRAIADFFEDARAYAKATDAAEKAHTPQPEKVPAWEAMLPYVRGQLPVMIHADEIREIKSAIDWADTNNYRIIIAGGRDAWRVAETLASKKIPVIYSHVFTLPARDSDSYDVHFRAAEVLHKAGVQVSLAFGSGSFDAALVRNLPYAAAESVAFGLPVDEALKSITLYPAQLMGVADRLGSIEPGKEATLVAASGDILDIRSQVKHLWLAGKEVNLENRQTRLYEKYKNRPKAN
jgi:imidazolonepropionase-like amidohydrolase